MNQIIQLAMRNSKNLLLAILAAAISICLVSDSAHYIPVESQDSITADQIAKSCAPSKIFDLNEVNISTGDGWKMGHSYHCLGRPHVVTTVNRVGLLNVDKLVSHAIVLNYVWLLNASGEVTCLEDVKIIKPVVAKSEHQSVLFAPYILTCQNVE